MTVKEISDVTNLSTRTIQRQIKKMFPDIVMNGSQTALSEEQSIKIVSELRVKVKHQIRPRQNVGQIVEVTKLVEVVTKQTNLILELIKKQDDRITLLENNQLNHSKQLEQLNQLKQLPSPEPEKEEVMTVKQYCKKFNINSYNPEAFYKKVGKECSRVSRQLNKPIYFVREGEYNAGAYDLKILKHAVEIVTIISDRENLLF